MAANELLVSSPPISQKPLSDAGAIGVVTAGKEVGDSCHCEERSAEVAEYEESANAVPRQSSARMPKRRSKKDGQNLGQENQPEAETEPSGVVIVVVSTLAVAP